MAKKATTKKEKPVSKPKEQQISNKISFPIVGIGASAGGLEALEQFFQNMPKKCGLAFVVIQHLDPNHVGIMPELLQRTTDMKVVQVIDHLQVKANHVYVIPPNKSMSVLNGYLHLFEPVESRGLRLPIDYFFRSLAEDQLDKSVGVILSGMGSDGSLGLKAIKEKNGIVLVQDPLTAKFDGMPQSAINAVVVDILAEANELPAKLVELLKYTPAIVQKTDIDDESKSNLEKIIILLRTQSGHDFSLYKRNTLYRRIERRMSVHLIEKIANYVRFLQKNPIELDILFKELLIGVTSFFRDALVWEKLKEKVLPDLFNELPNGHVLRAWVTACSTGEEAYSLAIIFKEAVDKIKHEKSFTLQIFATDIDSDAIEKARKGFFSQNIVADVESERISQFFTKEEGGFRVNTAIREMVVFAPQNVIKDPPFTKLDLMLCRNLLIYMEADLQKKLMNLFHYSLNAEGIMILGSAENENSQSNQFTPIDAKLKIYKRSLSPVNTELLDFPSSFAHTKRQVAKEINPVKITENIQTLADQILLQQFSPASVLINSEGDILYITGKTGKYLEPAAGKANWNIYAMAREGLNHELLGAIRKAKQGAEQVKLHNIKVGINGGTQVVDVTLQLIDKPEAIKGTIMIVFYDLAKTSGTSNRKTKKGTQNSGVREQEIELDLQRANEELQSTREEMQTTQEELKSTNEEMLSTNEELQSTNEELTTSKEEMQSLNEELQTVNIELQSKITDLQFANNDMKNLLNSTDIATLFLDKELNIRRFTDQLTKLIKLRQSDIGRPFTDMVTNLQYSEMADHANEVLRTLVFKEITVATDDQKWITVRIMPYRTFDDHIDGLVITFIDSTELTLAVNKSEENYKVPLENLQVGVVVHNNDGSVIFSNPEATRILGLAVNQMLGKELTDPFWNFVNEDLSIIKVEDYPVSRVITTKQKLNSYQLGVKTKDRDYITWVIASAIPVFSDNKLDKIIVNFVDITERKAADKLQKSELMLRTLFNSTKDTILVMGIEEDGNTTNFKLVNDAACKNLGYTREELMQLSPNEIDVVGRAGQVPSFGEKLLRDKHLLFESEHIAKDGRTFPVEISLNLFQLDGESVNLAIVRDITERLSAKQAGKQSGESNYEEEKS
ncbi:MAG: PAS domain S-box protein [Melioribacteraceae bacterium]|nr:PAS domain S-box protein [Melioribacteraceae bacterium]